MKILKNIKFILAAFLCLYAVNAYPANTINVQSPATVTGAQNGLFDVYVGVISASNLFGAGFVLNYDKNYLSAESVTQDTFLGSDVVFFNNIDNAAGKTSVGITKKAGQQSASGTGNLVKITFKILVNVSSQVTVPFTLTEVTANNETGAAVTLQIQNSSTVLTPVQVSQYTITVSASPTSGGTVTGGGAYNAGQTVTVKAVSANGYVFLNWKENTTIVSTNSVYSFTASANRNLVATFQSTANLKTLILGTANATANDSVIIPLNSLNLTNIGAVTIKINYDTTVLSFGRVLNWDSQLTGALAGVNRGVLSLVWDGITGADLSNHKIADIKFLYKGSALPTYLIFSTSTEIADVNGTVFSVTFVNGCVTSGVGIKGQVAYANTAKTPLKNAKVYLYSGTQAIDSVLTDNSGNYSFDGKANGNYTLKCSYSGLWGGVTSTDALFIRQYIASMRTFDNLQFAAADVNLSSTVSSVDALMLRKRIANPDSLFKAGDWVFDNPSVTLSGSTITQNIRALCTGDVNNSYTPTVAKSDFAVQFSSAGVCKTASNGIIELPVLINKDADLAALTLSINYPFDKYEVAGINSKLAGLSSSINNGTINLAWDDLVPVQLKNGEALLTLKLKPVNNNQNNTAATFTYNSSCEFADVKGNLVNLALSMPSVENTRPAAFGLNQNYPNPFNPSTSISFSIPVQSNVKLNVYNAIGQCVKELLNKVAESGTHTLQFEAGNLPSGIYFYNISAEAVDGSGVYKSVKKMTLLK